MDKRIKTVWALSILTMLFITCGQAYWLYSQYQLSYADKLNSLYKDCEDIIEQEQKIRQDGSYKHHQKPAKTDVRKLTKKYGKRVDSLIRISNTIKISTDSNTMKGTARCTFKFVETGMRKPRIIDIPGLRPEDGVTIANLYNISKYKSFQAHIIDSLFKIKGYDGINDFKVIKSKHFYKNPYYLVAGGQQKTVLVSYSSNPIKYENIEFRVTVPINSIIKSMASQLALSILFIFILAFCLVYQIKTIMIQQRIDKIRRQFMKNMIFEMKQPLPEDTGTNNAVYIGNITFFYSQNELLHGHETVIITSRQAEILRMLVDNANNMVARKSILEEVWGDDSYSNYLALNVQITYLLRALKSDTSVIIETVIGKGYILKANIQKGVS